MARTKKVAQKKVVSRFVWDDSEREFDIIRYDDEARRKTIEALLAESRAMLKTS